jgi:hypothetical protein
MIISDKDKNGKTFQEAQVELAKFFENQNYEL